MFAGILLLYCGFGVGWLVLFGFDLMLDLVLYWLAVIFWYFIGYFVVFWIFYCYLRCLAGYWLFWCVSIILLIDVVICCLGICCIWVGLGVVVFVALISGNLS